MISDQFRTLWEVNEQVTDTHPTVPNPYIPLECPPSGPPLVYSFGPEACLLLTAGPPESELLRL